MESDALITQKLGEARTILKELGLPPAQQNEMAALTFLALCGIKPVDKWKAASRQSLTVSNGIMAFIAKEYHRVYAANTRETVRRQVLHQFCQAHVTDYNPDDDTLPTNSPRAHYALTDSALTVVQRFGTSAWASALQEFSSQQGNLAERYRKERVKTLVPIVLSDGKELLLSPGKHNEVQAAVISQFAPRFAAGAEVLYLGDTAKKNLYFDEGALNKAGITITRHDKLPDLILFDQNKKWLFLIEVVTSHGPMTPKRVIELDEMLKYCDAGKVYVTAFPDFAEFRRHSREIAWETEVWLAEVPDHLIHYNGDKFFGPRQVAM